MNNRITALNPAGAAAGARRQKGEIMIDDEESLVQQLQQRNRQAVKRINDLSAALVAMAEECDRLAEENRILKSRLRILEGTK